MLGFLFKRGKFKLKEEMEVELEVIANERARSYFTEVTDASSKKATFLTPKEGHKYLKINTNDIIKCVALIDKTLYEVNLKVTAVLDREFEALVSKNVNHFDTVLSNFKKPEDLKITAEVPLDFRAMTTSHLQRAVTKTLTRESVEMVTNLPVPEGTDLKLIFRVPESPSVETEGTSEKSVPLEEDSRKSKTNINFTDKAKKTDMVDRVAKYIVHYQRRLERRKELEEEGKLPKSETEAAPPPAQRK